jgi:general secretion pathway protein G
MRSQGLTLVEGITLVFIVFVLSVAVAQVGGHVDINRVNPTLAAMKHLEAVLEFFKVDHGRYPESLQDLVHRPHFVDPKRWPAGGYLPELPIDEWGRPFYYTVPGVRGPFDLVSLGQDGKPGGEGVDADLWSHPPR